MRNFQAIFICAAFSAYFELLLNRLRESLQPAMARIGGSFASTGLSADFWTTFSLALSFAASIAYACAGVGLNQYLALVLGGALLLISGFFDIVDGSVARVTKRTSSRGAFLDSTFDKVAEVSIFLGIAYGRLADPVWCVLGVGLSLLVSYSRSRAESLGVRLQGIGIGERAERILIIAILGMLPFTGAMQWAVILVVIVAAVTLCQRIVFTAKKLST